MTPPQCNRKPRGAGALPGLCYRGPTMKTAFAAAALSVTMLLMPIQARADLIEPPSQGITTTRLTPPDAPLDAELAAMVEKLKAIVAARDAKGLIAMLSPFVTSSFGDDGGPERFVANYGLEGPEAASAPIWPEIERLLAIGVAHAGDSNWAAAPWPYALWPDDLDPFIHMVVVAKGESMRSAPKSDAPAIRPLDYDILTLLYDEENPDPAVTEIVDGKEITWLKVADAKGVEGFVRDDWMVSTIGYRLGFERSESGWVISFLVAGD